MEEKKKEVGITANDLIAFIGFLFITIVHIVKHKFEFNIHILHIH